jgi:hypothetical protein
MGGGQNSMTTSLNVACARGGIVALAALLLAACVPPTPADQAGRATGRPYEGAPGDAARTIPERPDVAFLIEDGLYAVPLAVDANGCEQFTTWSESGVRSLNQPIYFLDGEGSFTPTKLDDVSCNAEMVKTGTDKTGCPTFEAEQPDGTSSKVTYYPAANGYTVRRDRSSCG